MFPIKHQWIDANMKYTVFWRKICQFFFSGSLKKNHDKNIFKFWIFLSCTFKADILTNKVVDTLWITLYFQSIFYTRNRKYKGMQDSFNLA